MKFLHKSKNNPLIVQTLIYITSKVISIYRIRTKPNFDPRSSLRYDLVWNFLYSPYKVSAYFAESSSTLTICCSVK